jgi:citrate synthase
VCPRDRGCHDYEMNEKIERKVKKDKGIHPNVDFYSATVQHALGIPAANFIGRSPRTFVPLAKRR